MCVKVVIGLAIFLMLTPAFPEAGNIEETSQILKKLSEIDQRLDRIERSVQELQRAVSRVKAGEGTIDVRQTPEYQALKERLEGLQEKAREEPLKTLSEIWQAMGDPKELTRRLDMLVETFSPTISDADRRGEFQRHVQALKEKMGREVSGEELYEEVRGKLLERLRITGNEREKAWLRREVDALEKSQGEDRRERIARYVRIGNIRALQELANKYSIPRDQMVKCGLAFVGHEGRPPRHPGGERPGPPNVPAPGRTRPERDRDRPRS